MSRYSRSARSWNVRASSLARNTHNPIREIIEDLKLKPNPEKSYIPLSVGMFYSNITINYLEFINGSNNNRQFWLPTNFFLLY